MLRSACPGFTRALRDFASSRVISSNLDCDTNHESEQSWWRSMMLIIVEHYQIISYHIISYQIISVKKINLFTYHIKLRLWSDIISWYYISWWLVIEHHDSWWKCGGAMMRHPEDVKDEVSVRFKSSSWGLGILRWAQRSGIDRAWAQQCSPHVALPTGWLPAEVLFQKPLAKKKQLNEDTW